MEKIMKRILVVCVLVSIVIFGGCKKQEPTVPAVPEAPEVPAASEAPEVPAVPEVVEKVAENTKANTDESSKDIETLNAIEKAKAEEKLMAAAMAMVSASEQKKCPVLGNDIDKSIFTTYKGKKVYFCCKPCIATFEADPEKYIGKLPQFQEK